MSDTTININVKDAALLAANDKPGISVKLDDSSSDEPSSPKVLTEKESKKLSADDAPVNKPKVECKKAKLLDADDKPAQSVVAEASPNTEAPVNNTDSAETAAETAKEVETKTDDYVTEGGTEKADDSSSVVKTERESEEPMRKKEAERRALVKLAIYSLRKQADSRYMSSSRPRNLEGFRRAVSGLRTPAFIGNKIRPLRGTTPRDSQDYHNENTGYRTAISPISSQQLQQPTPRRTSLESRLGTIIGNKITPLKDTTALQSQAYHAANTANDPKPAPIPAQPRKADNTGAGTALAPRLKAPPRGRLIPSVKSNALKKAEIKNPALAAKIIKALAAVSGALKGARVGNKVTDGGVLGTLGGTAVGGLAGYGLGSIIAPKADKEVEKKAVKSSALRTIAIKRAGILTTEPTMSDQLKHIAGNGLSTRLQGYLRPGAAGALGGALGGALYGSVENVDKKKSRMRNILSKMMLGAAVGGGGGALMSAMSPEVRKSMPITTSNPKIDGKYIRDIPAAVPLINN